MPKEEWKRSPKSFVDPVIAHAKFGPPDPFVESHRLLFFKHSRYLRILKEQSTASTLTFSPFTIECLKLFFFSFWVQSNSLLSIQLNVRSLSNKLPHYVILPMWLAYSIKLSTIGDSARLLYNDGEIESVCVSI